MKGTHRTGFTLLELLTVIAIIAILAGITFAVFPRIRERGKIRRAVAAMNDIRIAMTMYYGDHATYPPGYGFVEWNMRDEIPADYRDNVYYHLTPYTARMSIDIHGLEKNYDEFAESGDTNRDRRIGLAEFLPMGDKNLATGYITFPEVRYTGTNNPGNDEVGQQLKAESRPFVYAPVNLRQFKKAKQYWIETGNFYAQAWDSTDPRLSRIEFPSRNYDAFVLISVGPGGSTYGVVPEPLGTESARDVYHITALRTYFLATRDLNDNGQRDFDFEARRSQGEAKLEYTITVGGNTANVDNLLPPPPASQPTLWGRNGWGAMIYVPH